IADQNGAVIPGATVVVTLTKTGVARTINADDQGRFRLIQLEPGVYAMKVSSPGFAAQERSELTLISGQNAQFDLVLLPEGVAAASSNNITIDGLDNNDDRSAKERFQPSLEAIDEVQIITNQFSAEYGRASGGRINIKTRGGARKFHGRGFFFFRDEALDANT